MRMFICKNSVKLDNFLLNINDFRNKNIFTAFREIGKDAGYRANYLNLNQNRPRIKYRHFVDKL